jgi:hypothetical membrane protein
MAAGSAPVFLIGGWTISAELQAVGYDPIRDTISALAAYGATDRWVMTAGLAGTGACYVIIAAGLHPAQCVGRLVLAVGGAATVAVALFPQPARGNSMSHTVAAAAAFVSLGAWPMFAARRGSSPPLLRRSVSAGVTVALLGLVGWFALELHGGQRGLAERAAAGAQALWPLAVVVSAWRFSTPRPRVQKNIDGAS